MRWRYRYSILGIIFAAYFLCYMDRMVIASVIPFIAKDLGFSPLTMGEVLSAFFVGYALTQIPGGILADRFGPRVVLAICIVWWSILTALTGLASGLIMLLITRVLFGVGEGPFPPTASKALSNWFPQREIARANGFLLASTMIGATVAPLLVVALLKYWSWRSLFFILAVPGLFVAATVWHFVRNSPAESRHVTSEELSEHPVKNSEVQSLRSALVQSATTPAILWCAASLFLLNMVAWGLMSWLPTYLLQSRGFTLQKMGTFAALTNLAGALGYPLGGYLCDKFFSRRLALPITFSLIISGMATWLAARATTGEEAVAYLLLVFVSSNVAATAIFTIPLVVVPRSAVGGAFGIVNTAGQVAGVLSPTLIGYVLNASHGNFEPVLYLLVVLTLLAVFPASQIRQPQEHRLA